MTARLQRRLHDESGLTLVELSVVMLLLALILAFAMQLVASFQRQATGGVRRLENLSEARILMQVITKDIRTAAKLDAATPPFLTDPLNPALVLADDDEVTFYANLNQTTTCPKQVHLYVDAGEKLIESVTEPDAGTTPPTCTYTLNAPRNRLVGRYIANAPDDPIFTFYYTDANGVLTAFCASAAQPGCTTDETPLTVENALLVKAVGIELAIRKDTSLAVDHTTIVNRVRLPNVYYNPPPSPSP